MPYPKLDDLKPVDDQVEYPSQEGTVRFDISIKEPMDQTTINAGQNYVWLNYRPSAGLAAGDVLTFTYGGNAVWRKKIPFELNKKTTRVDIPFVSDPQHEVIFYAYEGTDDNVPEPPNAPTPGMLVQNITVGDEQGDFVELVDFRPFHFTPNLTKSVRPVPIVEVPSPPVAAGFESFDCVVKIASFKRDADQSDAPNVIVLDTSRRDLLVPIDPRTGQQTVWPLVLYFQQRSQTIHIQTRTPDDINELKNGLLVDILAFKNDDPQTSILQLTIGASKRITLK